jgi:hypothetical protein
MFGNVWKPAHRTTLNTKNFMVVLGVREKTGEKQNPVRAKPLCPE